MPAETPPRAAAAEPGKPGTTAATPPRAGGVTPPSAAKTAAPPPPAATRAAPDAPAASEPDPQPPAQPVEVTDEDRYAYRGPDDTTPLRVTAPLAVVLIHSEGGSQRLHYYRGASLPLDADPDDVERLLGHRMLEYVVAEGQPVAQSPFDPARPAPEAGAAINTGGLSARQQQAAVAAARRRQAGSRAKAG